MALRHGQGLSLRIATVSLLVSAAAYGQAGKATISGVVTDPSGAVVGQAEVTVTNAATGQAFKTSTNEKGEWAVSSIPPATYRVSVSKTGFKAQTMADVLVNAGVPATVFGAKETTHNKINADLGVPDDPATRALFEFLGQALKK